MEEDLAFDFHFDSESANNSDLNELKSNDSTSSQSSKGSIWPAKKQARRLNSLIAILSTSYAREKLIRILGEDILISKQKWEMDKILAILTYH